MVLILRHPVTPTHKMGCYRKGRDMEKLFKLKANGTSVKTEIAAGLTTFMTMAYIIALNPNLLTNFRSGGGDELWNAVFLATCLASGIAMVCMAFWANKPFCLAPGMGLNSFFALVVTQIASFTGASYIASFQAALIIVLAEGIVFLILTLCNVREKIVEAIPYGVRTGIAPAIGLMLLNIGIGSNAGVYDSNGNCFYVMRDFFGSLSATTVATNMGDAYPTMVLTVVTMFLGLFAIILMAKRGMHAAVILGMLIASVIYWAGEAIFLGVDPFAGLATASWVPALGAMAELTLFKFNFATFLEMGWFTVITLIITFCMIDMFDTIGTLVGTASRAGMLDENGKMPQMKEAMWAPAPAPPPSRPSSSPPRASRPAVARASPRSPAASCSSPACSSPPLRPSSPHRRLPLPSSTSASSCSRP